VIVSEVNYYNSKNINLEALEAKPLKVCLRVELMLVDKSMESAYNFQKIMSNNND